MSDVIKCLGSALTQTMDALSWRAEGWPGRRPELNRGRRQSLPRRNDPKPFRQHTIHDGPMWREDAFLPELLTSIQGFQPDSCVTAQSASIIEPFLKRQIRAEDQRGYNTMGQDPAEGS